MKCSLVIAILLLTSTEIVTAQTTVVAIWSPKAIILGADSKGLRGGDEDRAEALCKIVQVGDFFFAASGLWVEPETGFGVAQLVQEAAKTKGPLLEKMTTFETLVRDPLAHALGYIEERYPARYSRDFAGKEAHLQVVFAGLDNGLTTMHIREFLVSDPRHAQISKRIDYPGNTPRKGYRAVYMGKTEAINEFRTKKPNWWRDGFVRGIENFIRMEIDQNPADVGPPIVILLIDANGARWLSKGDHCPAIRPLALQ